MNEKMLFLNDLAVKVFSVISNTINTLAADDNLVAHPTVITKDLIDSFHSNNDDTTNLELSSVHRLTKIISNSPIFYLCVAQKRYGRTFKPKFILLLNRSMHTLYQQSFDEDVDTICSGILNSLQENNF